LKKLNKLKKDVNKQNNREEKKDKDKDKKTVDQQEVGNDKQEVTTIQIKNLEPTKHIVTASNEQKEKKRKKINIK